MENSSSAVFFESWLKKARSRRIALTLLFVLTALSNIPIYDGQFFGEDETGQLISALKLVEGVRDLDAGKLFLTTAYQYHPPLRYWLSIPGAMLFPQEEIGVRLLSILFSFLMVFGVYQLGKKIDGEGVGFISALLIAVSPIFNLSSMAFCHSLIVVCLIYGTSQLFGASFDLSDQEELRRYRKIHLLVIIGFLLNTGIVLFFVMTTVSYFATRPSDFWKQFWATVPFALFYVAYYLFFLVVVPWVMKSQLDIEGPIGQLHQNARRGGYTQLNIISFLDNLKGLNAYFLPFMAWVLFVLAFVKILKIKWQIALWFSLYVFFWSFTITTMTHQYILIVFVAVLPFAISYLKELSPPRLLWPSLFGLAIVVASWNLYYSFGDMRASMTRTFLKILKEWDGPR